MFTAITVSGTDQFTATCPNSYNLLSCGNENTQTSTPEKYRKVWPSDSRTCTCYDHSGMACVAWCTTLPVPQFQIFNVAGTGTFTAQCPTGMMALGCHISTTARDIVVVTFIGTTTYYFNDNFRRHFPNVIGNSCTCKDTHGANCVTTCGSPTSHEVVSKLSSGTFTVSCTNSTYKVLGCGMDPTIGTYADHLRSVRVISGASCQCFDRVGATCYAICGQIW